MDECIARVDPITEREQLLHYRTSSWDGVRNSLAKRYMKEVMKNGDKVSKVGWQISFLSPSMLMRKSDSPAGPLLPLQHQDARYVHLTESYHVECPD